MQGDQINHCSGLGRGDGGLHQKGNSGGCGKWPYFGPVLNIEPTGFAGGLLWSMKEGKEQGRLHGF